MKYIFLDIDGVLNCGTGMYSFLHKDKVKMLSEIVRQTGAEIVLVSSWKDEWFKDEKSLNGAHAKQIDKIFAEFGIEVTDKTDDNNSWKRGKGIKDYLDTHPSDKWIILDDDFFPDYKDYDCASHLVRTAFSDGLTEQLKEEAIAMLS